MSVYLSSKCLHDKTEVTESWGLSSVIKFV